MGDFHEISSHKEDLKHFDPLDPELIFLFYFQDPCMFHGPKNWQRSMSVTNVTGKCMNDYIGYDARKIWNSFENFAFNPLDFIWCIYVC